MRTWVARRGKPASRRHIIGCFHPAGCTEPSLFFQQANTCDDQSAVGSRLGRTERELRENFEMRRRQPLNSSPRPSLRLLEGNVLGGQRDSTRIT
ncbi:hypothetical protein LY78DRAFT_5243 [Colletotrichum sublineola]|nr:hypothetical protein LY78DRAFT_5243 [Colletotrichum sublineola]